jgi:hypothetical protein
MKVLKNRYGSLVNHNQELQELARRYSQLTVDLQTNKDRASFYEAVKKLWKGIYQNGEKLKAEEVCVKCPKQHF